MHSVVSLSLNESLKAKVEAPYRSVAENGCADASLYTRFADGPLTNCTFFPQLLTLRDASGAAWAYREPFFLSLFDAAEFAQWQAAKALAVRSGTFVFASGLHCAVGTKPTA